MNQLFKLILSALLAITVCPTKAQDGNATYQLVFSDEFDLPDGSPPDPAKWTASQRQGATWSRWISPSTEVAFVKNGSLVCRAIPNPDTTADAVPMITGAMETRNKFSFTYGKVEVRLKTNLHKGNFPAAWMMPQPPADGWPRGGEIDIFESIDAQKTAYHTVHSHWTYDLGNRSNPRSSFSEQVMVNAWHVYGLEWTEDCIIWTVDGKEVGRYAKSSDPNALANGQWPFDHPFYLILNQSVGNGSWAKDADTSYTYQTFFDYVRVYQRVPDGVHTVPDTPNRTIQTAAIHDLSGRRVNKVQKNGIYLRGGQKMAVSVPWNNR